jgi:hypothetical protein
MRETELIQDPNFVSEQWGSAGAQESFAPAPLPGSISISTINGLTGPTLTFSATGSGFTFTPAGTTITLTSPLTTKGDLYTHDATTGIRLAVAANDARLTTDSTQATGLKWIAASTGWNNPTGTLSRGTYAAYAGQTVSNPPTQAEMQTLDDAVKLMSQTFAAILTDAFTQKIIKT